MSGIIVGIIWLGGLYAHILKFKKKSSGIAGSPGGVHAYYCLDKNNALLVIVCSEIYYALVKQNIFWLAISWFCVDLNLWSWSVFSILISLRPSKQAMLAGMQVAVFNYIFISCMPGQLWLIIETWDLNQPLLVSACLVVSFNPWSEIIKNENSVSDNCFFFLAQHLLTLTKNWQRGSLWEPPRLYAFVPSSSTMDWWTHQAASHVLIYNLSTRYNLSPVLLCKKKSQS